MADPPLNPHEQLREDWRFVTRGLNALRRLFRTIAEKASVTKRKPFDLWLALVGIAMGIIFWLFAKSPLAVTLAAIALFLLFLHPVWNFWGIENYAWRRVLALFVLAIGCAFIAYAAWPTAVLLRGFLIAGSKASPAYILQSFER